MITYPITDRENRRFTFRDSNGTHRGVMWPDGDGNPLPNPTPDLVIMEEFTAPLPTINDPSTEKLDSGQWIDDEPNQTTTFTYSVVAKSAEEQASYSQEQEISTNRVTLQNRIAAYEALKTTLEGITVQSNITDVVLRLQQVIDQIAIMSRDLAYILKWLDKRL